jgi:hypothetical protein
MTDLSKPYWSIMQEVLPRVSVMIWMFSYLEKLTSTEERGTIGVTMSIIILVTNFADAIHELDVSLEVNSYSLLIRGIVTTWVALTGGGVVVSVRL